MVMGDKKRIQKILDWDDPRREAYIKKRNLKNLVITRLKGNKHYTSLTKQYIRNQKTLSRTSDQELPRLLKV